MKPAAKAQEGRQTLIDGSHLFPGKLAKYAPDPPLVDESQMVDQCGPTSLAALHPALAGDPPNRLASAAAEECPGIFLGQAARPFLQSQFGELSAFGVGILKRSTKRGGRTINTGHFIPPM